MKQVFLSYADEDAQIAGAIHRSLTRSGVGVWGYKQNGRVGVDFAEEIVSEIRAANVFCLLDSRYARVSSWIPRECDTALQAKVGTVVCIVDREPTSEAWKNPELFPAQNHTRGIEFADFDTAIHLLCQHLEVVYLPESRYPRDRDFEKEILRAALPLDKSQQLRDLYHDFRKENIDPRDAEAILRVVCYKCNEYGAGEVVSPFLALGVLLGELGRHSQALGAFLEVTQRADRDPRGWAGAGGALYFLGQYESALDHLRKARDHINTYYPAEAASQIADLVHNIASTLIRLDRRSEAWSEIESLPAPVQFQPSILALKGSLQLVDGSVDQALELLQQAYSSFREIHAIPETLAIALAECYHRCGDYSKELAILEDAQQSVHLPEIQRRAADCYTALGRPSDALSALRKAVSYAPQSPVYRAQLACELFRSGSSEFREHARMCVAALFTPEEHYFRGLAFYLLGYEELMMFERAESRKSPAVAKWPNYSEVSDFRPGRT